LENFQVIGTLASSKAKNGEKISGIMVTKDFETQIMSPDDLIEFTELTTRFFYFNFLFYFILFDFFEMK